MPALFLIAAGAGCSLAERNPAFTLAPPLPSGPIPSATAALRETALETSPDDPRRLKGPQASSRPALGFDDPIRLTGLSGAEEVSGPASSARPRPATDDGVLGRNRDGPTPAGRSRRGRPLILDFSDDVDKEEQQDTNLDRSQAGRRGGGGGPTRSMEDDDERPETDEDEFKSNLLMNALGLEQSDITVFGWLQADFTGNTLKPRNGENFGVNPNVRANRFQFEQLYFVVEKLALQGDDVDFGFRSDNLFGTDWQQFHMNGFFDKTFSPTGFGWEPTQLYGEVHLPVLTEGGVEIKAGRFYALPGYESGLAPARPLPSGSYLFGYSHPFTHIGFMTTWHVTDRINLYNGAVNGWDRWLDKNERWGYSGALSWDSKDDRTNVTVTLNAGPNQFPRFFAAGYKLAPNGVPQPPFLAGRRNLAYDSNRAVLLTAVLIHKWTERFTLIAEADDGYETNIPGLGPGGTTENAGWYGACGWFLYQLTETLTGVSRAEVFRDNNGARTGFDATFYEMTLGGIYKPRSWFWLRPELRFDWSPGTPVYDDGHARSQVTLGFDAIFLF